MKLLNIKASSACVLPFLATQFRRGLCAPEESKNNYRFEKFNYTDPTASSAKITFPITPADADFLRQDSNSVSVVLPQEDCVGLSFTELKKNLMKKRLYPPPHPEDGAFWKEFKEVMKVVGKLKQYQHEKNTKINPLPEVMPRITHLWNGKLDITEVAEAVHDEFPGVYHAQLIAEWTATGSLERKSNLFPQQNNRDILRFHFMLSDLVGHAIRMVGPCVFALKWDVGMARPEEVAWKIMNDELEVPEEHRERVLKLLRKINYETFESSADFTAYPEGSPPHPSYPAMHSAASASSFWLSVTMNLSEEQLCEARMLDYSIAYARTVAGVHYGTDNITGLMMGQEILAQKLPRYLQDQYGADYTAVKEAVEEALFDWTEFKKSDCWRDCKYVKFRTRQDQIDRCATDDS